MGESLAANMGLFDCSWVEKGGTIRSAGAVETFWKDVCVISHQRICSEVAKKPKTITITSGDVVTMV